MAFLSVSKCCTKPSKYLPPRRLSKHHCIRDLIGSTTLWEIHSSHIREVPFWWITGIDLINLCTGQRSRVLQCNCHKSHKQKSESDSILSSKSGQGDWGIEENQPREMLTQAWDQSKWVGQRSSGSALLNWHWQENGGIFATVHTQGFEVCGLCPRLCLLSLPLSLL